MNECGYYTVKRDTNIRCMTRSNGSGYDTAMVFDTLCAADKWIDHGVRSHTLLGECPKESPYVPISIAEYNHKYLQLDECDIADGISKSDMINGVTKRRVMIAIESAIESHERVILELRYMMQLVE